MKKFRVRATLLQENEEEVVVEKSFTPKSFPDNMGEGSNGEPSDDSSNSRLEKWVIKVEQSDSVIKILDTLYHDRSYPRFFVLETIARVPYFVGDHASKDGAESETLVDFRGNPVDKSRTGGWLPTRLILGTELSERICVMGIPMNLVTYNIEDLYLLLLRYTSIDFLVYSLERSEKWISPLRFICLSTVHFNRAT